MFKLSKTSINNLQGVDPIWYEVLDLALTISLIDFGIPTNGGLRTAERQNDLYQQGRKKPGNIVTQLDGYDKRSVHQDGKAVDVFAYVDGKASWDELHLTHVATAILSAASQLGVPVKWGGHFKPNGWDKPHFEIVE